MTFLEPSIVPFVEDQFPLFYRENDPLFVAFVKAYYEWMESRTGLGSATRYARDFLSLQDVDSTTDQFLVYIKQKFLEGVQFDTKSDIRLLIKHAKDLYRAKGTERALQLFFQLLFDEIIAVYYPKDDILRASDGKWTRPTYIELEVQETNFQLTGREVRGLTTGAMAFVDSVVRRVIQGKIHDTAYISAIQGVFLTGEIIYPVDGLTSIEDCSIMVGSMNSIIVDLSGSGVGFTNGQVLDVNSPSGILGQVRVSNTTNQSGIIEIKLGDGGYGYSAQSTLYVSNTVLSLNVSVTNVQAHRYFSTFDVLTQPKVLINFANASSNGLSIGTYIQTYYANGSLKGNGQIMSSSYINSSAGNLVVSIITGNLQSNAYYTTGNSITANLSVTGGFVDQTSTGTYIGTAKTVLRISNTNSDFSVGDQVVQYNLTFPQDVTPIGIGTVSSYTSGFLSISNTVGVFRSGGLVNCPDSSNFAWVDSVSIDVGLIANTGTFVSYPHNFVTSSSTNSTATFVGTGLSSVFGVANNLNYTETIRVNTDMLSSITSLMINGPYSLPANTSANSSTPLSGVLTYANVLIGQLTGIIPIQPGIQLDRAPVVLIEDPRTSTKQVFDQTLEFTGATGSFSTGEVITQPATNARGIVRSSNATYLSIENMRYYGNNQFVVTSNSTTQILGSLSGSTANVASVDRNQELRPIGRNATATSASASGEGAVTEVQVLDSGFGYLESELVWMDSPGVAFSQNSASGLVQLSTSGTGRGFYTQKGGFLSDQKKLFDGDYWQEFSYEIQSSQTLDKYVDMLKSMVHVAGMKVFGKYVHSRQVPVTAQIPNGAMIETT